MSSWPKRLMFNIVVLAFLPAFLLAALLPGRRRTLYVWGSAPLLCNRYWCEAMREAGFDSVTIMSGVYGINRRDDFDRLFEDFAPNGLPRPVRFAIGSCLALIFLLRRARVLHGSFFGFALGLSAFWRLEGWLLRRAGVRTILIAYGFDAWLYSSIIDPSLRHALLSSYPELARNEPATRAKVDYWNRHASILLTGLMIDGLGRWDVTFNQLFSIDTRTWSPKADHNRNDGRNGSVKVLHTPNHRGFKGTEFVVEAVERLRGEGLDVELVLLEGVPNDQVRPIMQGVDILAEQFIATGYAMSGIEGMASGLPVMANLEHEAYTRVFRRYSFLDECPILSTTPETLADNLRLLVTNPDLRAELGRAGRHYVEKYHSYATAQHLFGSIYDKILEGGDVDLINLFHPLKSAYVRDLPRVEHPLVENRLPPSA